MLHVKSLLVDTDGCLHVLQSLLYHVHNLKSVFGYPLKCKANILSFGSKLTESVFKWNLTCELVVLICYKSG